MGCNVCVLENKMKIEQSQIIGKWVSSIRSEGGLGGVYFFGKDQNLMVLYGAIIDSRYQIFGTKIVESSNGKRTESNYTIEGDILTIEQIWPQKPPSECKLEMKRLGNHNDHSSLIVGKWTYKHKTGAWVIQEYTADGRAQLLVPLIIENGKYNLSGNKLSIQLKDKKNIREISIEKNRLVFMSDEVHSEEIYLKF